MLFQFELAKIDKFFLSWSAWSSDRFHQGVPIVYLPGTSVFLFCSSDKHPATIAGSLGLSSTNFNLWSLQKDFVNAVVNNFSMLCDQESQN